ncbi:MAG: GNAT family N-acetyltransferase [Bacteroidota bacterium]
MIEIVRTNAENTDFQHLVSELDELTRQRDGADHDFYFQFNGIESLRHVLVAYEAGVPLACGAIKPHGERAMEVKRMYVRAAARGRGIATELLRGLEHWARELGRERCVLETGVRYPEAIALYRKNDYQPIPNYDQYENVATSRCFGKAL